MTIQRPNSFHGSPDGTPYQERPADNGSAMAQDINVKPGKRFRNNTYTTSWREWEQLAKGPGAAAKPDFITTRSH